MTVIKSSACRRVKFEMPVRQLNEMLSRYLDIQLANFYLIPTMCHTLFYYDRR